LESLFGGYARNYVAHNCHGKIFFVTAKSFWPRQNHFGYGKIIFVTAKSFSTAAKSIWPRQNHFRHGKIILATAKSFSSRQNHFGHGKIIFVTAKPFWPRQNHSTAKSFLSRQNHFGHGKIILATAKSFSSQQNHFNHGKIIFVTAKSFRNRGKIIFNQGKYILYARDLCSSYKMGLEGLRDSHFTSLYAAPYLGLLTNFASCAFVVGLVGGFSNGQLSRYNLGVVFLRLCSRGHI